MAAIYKVNTQELQMKLKSYKKTKLINSFKFKAAFTLVELMVVVAVIGVVAGIVLAAAGGAQKKAARDQAKAEIKMFSAAIERYKSDFGFIPQQATGSRTALYRYLSNYVAIRTNQLSGSGTNTQILDPYGRGYLYVSPGTNTRSMLSDGFEIWSQGVDTNSTRDDITSW